jgi:hypothetical protein
MSGEVTAWVPGHLICNGEGQTAGGKPHRGLWRLATSFVRSTRLMAAAGGSPDFVDQSRRAAGYVGRILHPQGRADDGGHLQFMVVGSNGIKTLLLFIRLRQWVASRVDGDIVPRRCPILQLAMAY